VEIVKRVYILSRGSLFLEGIETLLSGAEGFTIVGAHTEVPTVECIQSCNPDVIIINLDDPEPDLSLALLCVLKERLGIAILGLSLRDNKICIYRGEDKQIFEVEDLYKAIQE
jgi:DNA-binding NarL/FixJ family response regulator